MWRICRARRARRSVVAFSVSNCSAGRRWCRSLKPANRTVLAVIERLAQRLVAHFGAPDIAAARAAAEEEVAFATSLCNQPKDSLIAVHRTFEGGETREAFRTLHRRGGPKPLRAFSFLEVEGEEEPADEVDLVAIAEQATAK